MSQDMRDPMQASVEFAANMFYIWLHLGTCFFTIASFKCTQRTRCTHRGKPPPLSVASIVDAIAGPSQCPLRIPGRAAVSAVHGPKECSNMAPLPSKNPSKTDSQLPSAYGFWYLRPRMSTKNSSTSQDGQVTNWLSRHTRQSLDAIDHHHKGG